MKICKQGSADSIRRKLEQYDEKFKCGCCGCKFSASYKEYRVNYYDYMTYGILHADCPYCGTSVSKRGFNDYGLLRQLKEANRHIHDGDDNQ